MRNLKKNENAIDVTFMILVFVDVELCIKSLILGGFLFKKNCLIGAIWGTGLNFPFL